MKKYISDQEKNVGHIPKQMEDSTFKFIGKKWVNENWIN